MPTNLNEQQKQAICFGQGPLLIIAGAGTGKTTVITQRIAEIIKNKKAKPEEILALTFTDQAANEMEQRIEKLVPQGFIELWISTFHSFGERILKNYGLDIGISSDFRLLKQTGAWLLMRQNLNQFNLDYYKPLGNPSKFIHSLLNHFSRCKDEGIYPEDYLKYSDDLRLNLDNIAVGSKAIKPEHKTELACLQQENDRIKEIADTYHAYQRLLLENNYLDFGDLINYSLKLFKQRPIILEKFKKQFKYILIDEFQDTNWAQYQLIKLLSPPQNNITVSFDDDQAIFLWRGASFNNVLQFKKDYPEAKEIVLIKNYRSCQNILDLSYKFIQFNNPNRLEYQLNQIEKTSQEAQKNGIDLTKFKKINKKLKADTDKKGIIQYLCFENAEQEIQGVINKIIKILDKSDNTNFNDFAILCRTNAVANIFSKALERANIPNQYLSSKGLYSKPVILDIISYFKLLLNYYDNSAFYCVLNSACFKIPYKDIIKINEYSLRKTCSIYEALADLPLISEISPETAQIVNHISNLLKKHILIAKEKNVSQVFVNFLQDSGYLDFLVKSKKDARENLDLINQFYDKIKQFEEEQINPKLINFMQQLDMEIQSGEQGSLMFNPDQGEESIKIITVHSAKGLEFKYVFLVNLADKKFPTIQKKEPIEIPEALIKEIILQGDIHIQEERRLFYVGMTRAKKGLFFTSAKNYGPTKNKKPSQFLIECGLTDIANNCSNKTKSNQNELIQQDYLTKCCFTANIAQNNKQIYNIPNHFSFTQLAAFERCPLQYKFAHILRLPIKGKPVFSFGKTMHNTLFEFVNKIVNQNNCSQKQLFPKSGADGNSSLQNFIKENNQELRFNNLLEIYKKNWIDEWYENKEQKNEYYKKGKKTLKIFFENFLKNPPKIKVIKNNPCLEQSFNLKINGHPLIGKIDRIDEINDCEVEIIDYKTGAVKTKLQSGDKDQLLIYQIAAEQVLGLKPKKLVYYYLENNTRISFLGSEKDKQRLKEKIIEMIKKIKQSDFSPLPGFHCQFCDFKHICEFRKI